MEILNYDEQPPSGSVLGIFSVYMPKAKITYHKLKLIRSKNGKLFVAFPAYAKEDEMGQKKYYPYVSMEREVEMDFQAKVLEALQPYLR